MSVFCVAQADGTHRTVVFFPCIRIHASHEVLVSMSFFGGSLRTFYMHKMSLTNGIVCMSYDTSCKVYKGVPKFGSASALLTRIAIGSQVHVVTCLGRAVGVSFFASHIK